MSKALAVAFIAMLSWNSIEPAMARETNPSVLADYQKHQAKKKQKTNKHHKKKTAKVERVPMAKLRNCQMKRKWMPPKTIKEVKICEVTP
jgi:hypothetical protein